jgi:MFS transporter, MHS family, proline/betaine transporter
MYNMSKNNSSYVIAVLATIVRYYDYALFGLSASVISKTFMFGRDDSDQMLLFFAIFSLAVIARPFGSILFGKIGDRISRIASMKTATIIAAISTSAVALIPSFDYIGWGSVILLTICRMAFLISLSGEIDAIKIFVAEKIGKERRNFAIGVVAFASQLGVILASIMYHISVSIEGLEYLWRLNFILGGFLGLLVILMRGALEESNMFLNSKSRLNLEVDYNIARLIFNNRLKFFLAMLVNGMLGGGYHFLIIFLGTFASNVADLISSEQASANNIILITLYGFGCLISGYLADKISTLKQIFTALSISIIIVIIMQSIITMGVFSFSLHKVLAFTVPFYSVPCAIKLQSLFATGIRMRMYSLSHSVGSMIFSSTTPFFCMLIWRYTGLSSIVIGYFLIQLGILFFTLIYINKKDFENFFET